MARKQGERKGGGARKYGRNIRKATKSSPMSKYVRGVITFARYATLMAMGNPAR